MAVAERLPLSRDTLEAMSWASEEGGVDEPWVESRERVDAEGERTCAGRGDLARGSEAVGTSPLPLPSTLPPPSVRLDMTSRSGFHVSLRSDSVRRLGGMKGLRSGFRCSAEAMTTVAGSDRMVAPKTFRIWDLDQQHLAPNSFLRLSLEDKRRIQLLA